MESIGVALSFAVMIAAFALFKGDPSLLDALIAYLNHAADCPR